MLLEATRTRRVKWIEKGGTVVVQLPDFDVEIWSGSDERTDREFVAIGLKESQKLLDNWYVEEGDEDFAALRDLWDIARRQARGVPEKLEALRQLLRRGGQLGKDDDTPF
jgi:hypothetical protein